jgi:hypothetical protein
VFNSKQTAAGRSFYAVICCFYINDKERKERITRPNRRTVGKSAEPRPAMVQSVNAHATSQRKRDCRGLGSFGSSSPSLNGALQRTPLLANVTLWPVVHAVAHHQVQLFIVLVYE